MTTVLNEKTLSGPADHLWTARFEQLHFLPWSDKTGEIGQRKENIILLSSFIPSNLNLTILSKNIQPFNPYFSSSQSHASLYPWPFILDLPYYSSFSSKIFLMLLSSPCSHNNPISTTLCNMTRVATRVGGVAPSVRLGSACREIFSYPCTSGCIPMASFITTSLTIKITTGVKKNKNIINNKKKYGSRTH